jgi:hypothetical protein
VLVGLWFLFMGGMINEPVIGVQAQDCPITGNNGKLEFLTASQF